MDQLFNFILSQAEYAHFYIFGLFMLAGFNIPVSEDVLIIAGAIISVKFAPENAAILFIACYMGAYISDVICYFLGRTVGIKLLSMRPFSKLIDAKKVETMSGFFERYGTATLFFGRFIPFGVRNALFLSAGISKMNFVKFAVVDLLACTITSAILFSLGRLFAENYEVLFAHIADSKWVIAAIAITAVSTIYFMKKKKKAA
jgi:membrane protein DedA with SNARE-associated domain